MEKARELFRLAYLTDPASLPGVPKEIILENARG
jgi:hypothetical protein